MAVCGSYEAVREGDDYIIRVDCEECSFFPSLEDNPDVMELALRVLVKEGQVTRLVFVQKREYEYDGEQVQMLVEVAKVYRLLSKELAAARATLQGDRLVVARLGVLQNVCGRLLLRDPVGAFVQLARLHDEEDRLLQEGVLSGVVIQQLKGYYALVREAVGLLDKTVLVVRAKPFLKGFVLGDRGVYRRLFLPSIRPDFMFAKLMTAYPVGAEELESYEIVDSGTGEKTGVEVTLFRLPGSVQVLYHVVPPEFRLDDDVYDLLDAAKKQFEVHQPTRSEFLDPSRLRQTFTNLGSDLLLSLAQERGMSLSSKQLDDLTRILLRYSIGFGLIEVLLLDQNVQDVVINSPVGRTPVFVVHDRYDECVTNIIPTVPEANSWASKLRLVSGRPLDEANPILDTELVLPGARSRVAAIYPPLNPSGLAFALRRHRDRPWTLPLFMKVGYLDAMAAGLISFLVDGNRTILVAGTRSAGKTSLLGALMVEIMRKRRVITIEDSVTGDSRIVVEKNGRLEKTTVGELIDGLIAMQGCEKVDGREFVRSKDLLRVYAMGKDGKVRLVSATQCMRHKVEKPIYQVTTSTGRRLKVTGDHALFTLGTTELLMPVRASELKIGDCVVTPRILPNEQVSVQVVDLSKRAHLLSGAFFEGEVLKSKIGMHWKKIRELAFARGYAKGMISHWKRVGILPCEIVADMGLEIPAEQIVVKKMAGSKKIPALIRLTPELLTLVGLWLADGSYDKNSIIISVVDPGERAIVTSVASQLGLVVRMHSDGVSLMLNARVLKDVFQNVFELLGNAYTKKIPKWVFGLSKEQIAQVLKGLLSGDGCVSDKEVVLCLASQELLNDAQILLLQFGIIMRMTHHQRPDKTFNARISSLKMWQSLNEHIGFLQKYKQQRLEVLCQKISTHDTTDIIPFVSEEKGKVVAMLGLSKYDYLKRDFAIGRKFLGSVVEENAAAPEMLRMLADSDILWDKIISVERVDSEDLYVYDFSVPGYENFVCENILAHNTLELPVDALRKLNYNIQSLKVASALSRGTTEVSADEGIRTTLRMGDSALIVGEVRSTEARALYESMRVGALANVVAGTIHGDSPYGVYDRVVNDLQVPKTSFKATDVILVANRVRSVDGLKSMRKLTQITEVRKTWESDPLLQGGFVDLMRYDAKKELAQVTSELLHGDSEVLKSIAGTVKDFAGNWDAVWENINLRARVKQAVVDAAVASKNDAFLEAEFVMSANDEFHMITERVREEVGLDSERVYREFMNWLRDVVRKKK